MKTPYSPVSKLQGNSTSGRLPAVKPIRLIAIIAAVWLLLLAGASVSRAAGGSWNGSTDAYWTNALNWSASPAPGAGDTATFNGGGNGVTTIDLLNGVEVGNILFNSSSAAPYTIGAGAAGSQTLTLDANGGITMSPTVTSNQVLNANLALPAIGFYNIVNNSAANTLTLAGTISSVSTGSTVLTVDGTGATAITGPIVAGTGSMGLQKTNSGTLTLSGGGYFSATNVNDYLPGASYVPVDLRSGTTIISSGVYTNIGEFTVGGVIADGGAGNNVNLTMNGGSLAVSTWFSLGRGNGIGGVSSDLVLNNNASITSGNISCGFNVNSTNLPKGSVTLNNSSTLAIAGNGALNFAESAGSAFTMTMSNSSQFIGLGTGTKNIGLTGSGTLTLNDSSMVNFGNAICYVGHNYGTGVVTVASANAVFQNAGEIRVGGSDQNGTGRYANGTFILNAGTVNVGALSIGYGNNNQNGVNGVLYINGGTFTSTNDVLLAFAGATNTSGRIAMNGGTLNVGTTVVKWLRFGQWDFTYGAIDITNGNLNLNSGSSIKFDQNGSTGPKTFNQYGGNVTFYSDFATTPGGSGNLDLMLASTATGINTYNLNGGTLSVPQIISSSATGSRIFNFNGGKLVAVTPVSPFFASGAVTVANVRDGGAIIDCNGYDITIAQPLVHSTVSGDAANDGGLTKNGSGSLTLSGAATYTGNTIVNGGTLIFSGVATYTGNTIVNGGTLSFSTANFTPATAGSLTVSNATLALDVSSGISLPASSVTLQNNAALNFSYGALAANPSTPAINAAGGLSAPGSAITININALGLKSGQFALIKYTGTALASIANFSVTLPPGVVATLVNNTGNHSIDLNVTTSPNFLTWFGLVDTNWDIGATPNWKNGAAVSVYQQYTNGAAIVGDAVQFDDTVTNFGINPPTNINLTLPLYSFPIFVNSTLPYRFSGPGGITGGGYVVKTNVGSLSLNTSNSYTGGTFINAGSVVITNDFALGGGKVTLAGGNLQANASITSATRAVTATANSTIGVATNATFQLGGAVDGSGGLTKIDNGTLVLAGNTTLAGTLTVNQGKLTTTGNEVLPAVPIIGNVGGQNAMLNIAGGAFQANNDGGQLYSSSLTIGNVANSVGDVVMSSGTLTVRRQLTVGQGLAAGTACYGAFNQSGGTTTIGGFIALGGTSGGGLFNQSGGTINLTNCSATIGYNVTNSYGVMNLSGTAVFNTFNNGGAYGGGVWPGEVGNGTLNVSGNAALTITRDGIVCGRGNATGVGTVNLNGGTATVNSISRRAGSGTLNFNGGTLKANVASSTFVAGLTSASIYTNGATIDDGGFSITISQPLLAPTGYGISAIPLYDGGSGYVDAPIVTVYDQSTGYGSNATAIAQIDPVRGTVTNIVITCPGSGFDPYGSFVGVSFTGGGANANQAIVDPLAVVLVPNASGGLTKKGSGTLTLTGANTYTNTTSVSAGALLVAPAQQVTGAVTVASNAAFGVLVNAPGAATVGNLTLGVLPVDKASLSFGLVTGSNPTNPVLQVGTLTLNGTNTVRLSGTINPGTFPIVKYTGPMVVNGSAIFNTNVVVPQGQTATLSNSVAGTTLYVTVTGVPGIVWTGTNSAAALTNVWGLNSVTNWLAAGVPASYQETTPPGDGVTFNDIGSGLVLLSNTVSPTSIQISNNAVNYTFRGTGHISGTTGLTKQGSGTATISLTNSDYTGNTTISGGTLQLGSATTLPDGVGTGTLTVNSPAKVDLNGFSETINGLTGSGIIDNSSGTATVLTLGNGNGSVTWGGSITSTGTGGSSILKVGTGNTIITGTNYLANTAQSQINGGSLLITNGGALYMTGGGEFWVMQNAGTASATVDGGTLVVSNNWLVVARNNVAAIGTLTVNHGLVQKAGANNIVVGSLGANGTLIVNGGQVLNNGNLWLGENAGANAALYLNGGLIQATQVRVNGTGQATSVAYFNGGTLQATASSTNFIQIISGVVMSNSLVLDDNGFTLTINSTPLLDGGGGGGLVKEGSGTVYLDAANTYTGTTLVTNGTLAGIGSIAGSAVVATTGNLGAGDAATNGIFTIGGNLTLGGNATLRINKTGGSLTNDQVAVTGSITYGGVLTVANITSDATPLVIGDTFQVFNKGGSGNFTSIVGSGAAYSFNPATGILTVTSIVVGPGTFTNPTGIKSFSLNGANIVITGTNGQAGDAYYLLQSTNVALPLSQWKVVATNVLSANGNFTFTGTNVVTPGGHQQFYLLSNTNSNH